ncbi:ABC transporter substrate-binding protein [Kozakia baliensis]|uniref:ABC transporter substrate-binding protein n=1 Tax=Kozakia baliensis TaxID=153496 RepID=UPI00345C16A8
MRRLAAFIACFGIGTAHAAIWDGQTLGSPHRGGTLHLTADAAGGTLDPQINYTSQYLQLFVNAYDGLLTFRQAEGKAGLDVVPDLAEALPEVSPDGLSWRFILRQGIRFSDGRPVRVADVVATMRRIYIAGSPTAASFYGGIAGAKECLDDPSRCTLPGVEGDEATRRITFHLTHPDGEFLQKLAFPHAVILPADASPHDVGNVSVPGTGPYRIESYDANHRMVLERNPYFHVWNPEAQTDGYVDRIEYDFGLSDEAQITAVEQGRYDWMLDAKPQDRLGELGSHYTAQVHIQPLFGLYYMAMNIHEPPFDSELVRRAINEAVDRHAMTILYGGSAIAEPLCQIVPHGLPGADIPCLYGQGAPAPTWQGPNFERAREWVRQSGRAGSNITLIVPNQAIGVGMGVYLRNMLQVMGFHASVRPMAPANAESYARNSDNHVQISLAYWFADYPSPSTFLDDLLGCDNYHPHSDSSTNASGYCDAALQKIMRQAEATLDPAQAATLWQQAGIRAMQASAIAPLIQMRYVDFVSKRLGNYFYTPLDHMLFSHVWVR